MAALIGSGGMGQVYRARDTKLDREVAIKILPAAFAHETERLARFQREAKTLASLNHPNIAHIHGLEESGGMTALVMELVEGDDLSQRIARGAIPIDEALPIAKQIAEALEAAHEQGIIHRDLKPANIKVRSDGTVKVLDFGLAKAMDVGPGGIGGSGGPGGLSMSPTITTPAMTQAGMILGTAAYMSPEQARGKPVDKRADLWAFGAVLYQMLTGRPAFEGDGLSDILAQILTKEPDWHRLPAHTPVPVVRLLRRCLEKDPRQRLDSAAVARLEVNDALSSPWASVVAPVAIPPRRAVPWAIATAVAIALIVFGVTRSTIQPLPSAPTPTSRFAIVLPPAQTMPSVLLDRDLALSHDGRSLVYRVGGSTNGGSLALRDLDRLESHLLPGIDNGRAPFFSPDGRWIGFFAGSELKKIAIVGGPAITICGHAAFFGGAASWGDDDTIVFGSGPNLLRVSAGGGEPTVLARFGSNAESALSAASLLPGGRGVLVALIPVGSWFTGSSEVAVLDLKTGQHKTLIRGASAPQYVPVSARTGYVVYAAADTLLALPFDLERLDVLGDPVPVVEHVDMAASGAANFDISRAGTLVYVPAGAATSRSLVWVDRAGRETPTNVPPHAYSFLRLSPDGTRVVLADPEEHRLWIWDLARETLRSLTAGSSENGFPIWTRDSRSIIFTSNRSGAFNLYSQLADGSGPVVRLTMSANRQFPNSMTRDGSQILGAEARLSSRLDIVVFSAASAPQAPNSAPAGPTMPFAVTGTLVQTPALEYNAISSPEGRFFAYQSNESGRMEIYVKPFPPDGDVRWQLSTTGGTSPVWAPNGRELFYRDVSNAVIAVPVETNRATWHAGSPTKLLDSKYAAPTDMFNYEVSPDGQRFLMFKETTAGDRNAAPANIVVVINWLEELKRLAPIK